MADWTFKSHNTDDCCHIALQQQQQQQQQRKHVVFSEEQVQTHIISRMTDYTERQELWYGAKELLSFQCCPRQQGSCTRGLEARTIQGANRKREAREDVIGAVLELQYMVLKMGIEQDPEVIADLSMQFSQPSKDEARLLGILDERYVETKIRKSPPKLCTISNNNMNLDYSGCEEGVSHQRPARRLSLVGPAA